MPESTKKTRNRKGPNDSATLYYPGTIMEGNDGREWEVKSYNGIQRWVALKDSDLYSMSESDSEDLDLWSELNSEDLDSGSQSDSDDYENVEFSKTNKAGKSAIKKIGTITLKSKIGNKPLRLFTVNDAKKYYRENKIVQYWSQQTFGGLDADEKIPTYDTKKNLSTFVLNGTLKKEYRGKTEIYPNWLGYSHSGPYSAKDKPEESSIFYYLGVYGFEDSEDENGHYWVQVCYGPKNVLSTDCLDETNIWIPK